MFDIFLVQLFFGTFLTALLLLDLLLLQKRFGPILGALKLVDIILVQLLFGTVLVDFNILFITSQLDFVFALYFGIVAPHIVRYRSIGLSHICCWSIPIGKLSSDEKIIWGLLLHS